MRKYSLVGILVSRDLVEYLKSGARYLRQKIINLEFVTWVTIWLITRLMPQKLKRPRNASLLEFKRCKIRNVKLALMFLSNCLLSSRVLLAGLVVLEAPFLWGNAATSEHVMATCVCGFPFCRGV